MKKILIITNGHGEDQVARLILEQLSSDFKLSVLPLVGQGLEFKDNKKITLLGTKKHLPGGGFSFRNIKKLPKDIRQGLISSLLSDFLTVFKNRREFDLVIAVGDIVPLFLSSFIKAPLIFVGVNKSSYYKTFGYGYTPWERRLMRKKSKIVFTRDQNTALDLKKYGINAVYAGNPLMDGLPSPTKGKDPEFLAIGFLPGTRTEDISKNMEDFNLIAQELKILDPHIKLLLGLKQRSVFASPLFELDSFENVVHNSDVILGLSGTGNEQAVGAGKPVVAFYGRGAQYNKKFADAQKELLGDALLLFIKDHKKIALEIYALAKNREKLDYFASYGPERMGESGGISRIREEVFNLLK